MAPSEPLALFEDERAVIVPPTESPDWGHGRVRRAVLMTPSADWIQSVFSCRFELGGRTFVVPNRDYPYEGLSVYEDGENWKLVDCVALAFECADGTRLTELRPLPVRITPWRVTYGYGLTELADGDGEPRVLVTYYLCSAGPPDLVTGCVELTFPDRFGDHAAVIPILRPMIDVRHMYGTSDFGAYDVRLDADAAGCRRLSVRYGGHSLAFLFPEGDPRLLPAPETLRWWYKLGTGSRLEGEDEDARPATLFRGEEKRVAAFFDLRLPAVTGPRSFRIEIAGGLGDRPAGWSLAAATEALGDSLHHDDESRRLLEEIVGPPGMRGRAFHRALVGRLAGLTKFKIRVRTEEPAAVLVPHAGAWWFKNPWYRDVFEGILSSFEVLMRIPEERDNLRRVVLLALADQEPTSGRIPNKLPEFRHHDRSYAGSDATLLCLIAGHRWAARTGDQVFAARVAAATEVTIGAFRRASAEAPQTDGPPRIDRETGLVLSAPHHSWIDTRSQVVAVAGRELSGLPSRVSAEYVRRLAEVTSGGATPATALEEVFSSPRFFLPEINAQWIVVLRGVERLLGELDETAARQGLREDARELSRRAEASFLRVFWDPPRGSLYNLVFEDAATADDLACEAAVTAAAMLGTSVFDRDQLRAIWRRAEKRLLVRRRLVELGDGFEPFGILTRNERRGVFYGDDRYHADVVWPRSTPYLITLLRQLGEEETVRGLLRNALDHQMSEGAVFFNHELLAPPLGRNPRPDPRTAENPVPVKNPVQFWSQWCDPFLDFPASGGDPDD